MERHKKKITTSDLYSVYDGNNVIVLGASGFIGRWLARELCRNGAKVFLIIRNSLTAKKIFEQYGVDGKIIELDLAQNSSSLIDVFKEIKPAITFNLAGYGIDRTERDHDTAYKINSDLVKSVCEAVASTKNDAWLGQDIIHIGTALEYGEIGGDLAENSHTNPTTLYGQSKLAGTRLLTQCCRENKLRGMTIRLFTVYGPGEHVGRLLPSLINVAHQDHPLQLTAGLQKRDFTYIADVVEGLLRLGVAGASKADTENQNRIVNLASGRLTTVRDFVETAAKVLGINSANLQFGAIPVRSEEMAHLPVLNSRLYELTHWSPSIGISEGVHHYADFLASLK